MEKLIDLLNEFHFFNTEYIGYYFDKEENRIYFKTEVIDKGITNEERISNERLISKKFGFIKWLVENDKIDFYTILKENGTFRKEFYTIENEKEYERLIMLLAIQDSPIEFLISVLR